MNQSHSPELEQMSPESDHESSGSFGAWTLVWTLVAMKIATIVIVIVAAGRAEAGTLFAVITWHWLVLLGALLAVPVLFRYRLRRVRSRREALLRAEWMVDEISTDAPVRTSRSVAIRQDVRVP